MFCEDIREEIQGKRTIVGTFNDNITVPGFPGQMSQLGIFMRANFPPTRMPKRLNLKLEAPWLKGGMQLGEISKDVLEQSRKKGLDELAPTVGLVVTGLVSPFPVLQAGRVNAILDVDGKEYLVGFINFVSAEKNSASPLKTKALRRLPSNKPKKAKS